MIPIVSKKTDLLVANKLSRLLEKAEDDIASGRTRPIRAFLREFKKAHNGPSYKEAGKQHAVTHIQQ